MAREPVAETLHGHLYTVRMMGTSTGLELVRRLAKVVGPALGSILDGTDAGVSLGGLLGEEQKGVIDKLGKAATSNEGGLFATALNALVRGIDNKADVDWIVNQLAQTTHVQIDGSGKMIPLPSIYELHFAGLLKELGEWLVFALKVQLGLFSKDLESEANPQVQAGGPQ